MKKLSELAQGARFLYGGVEWVKFEDIGAGTLCLAAEPVFLRAFDEENCNDWRKSSLRRELNGAFLDALVAEGADRAAFLDWESDLTADDGMTDYGTAVDKIALRSDALCRKYRDITPPVDVWCWNLTPWTCDASNSYNVRYVFSSGALYRNDAYYGYRTVKKTGKRQNGKSIDKRPEIVDQRTTFGHWEGDTVYSKKDGSKALLVLTERLTRWEIIARIKDRTANSVIKALDQIERRFGADLFAKAFQTITFDNGGEFSDVERLERSAVRKGRRRTTAYFCHPYSSYERGSNECQNKMIRRKFPKGTDFGAVSAVAVKRAEDWINNYPREILGWKTAEICFRECLAALA